MGFKPVDESKTGGVLGIPLVKHKKRSSGFKCEVDGCYDFAHWQASDGSLQCDGHRT